MRILYTGTYNSVLSFLAWNVIIYTHHNTRLYVAQYIAKYGSTAVFVYIPSA